ncbi:MAG: hypothetical protein HY561_02975 [Gemmatimonadetes bacterium]|nr:hypothetical protein [Gemmatimonadota bacterium]
MSALWQKLNQRKIVQWAVAYLAAGWLALQVTGFLAQSFGWPALLLRSFTVLAGVGFLAVLIVAWYHGERGQQRVSGVELLMLATLLVIAGATLSLVRPTPKAAGSAKAATDPSASAPPAYQASVAVLPFDEIGARAGEPYFSEGITEEIISELAKVEGLKVISRTSVVALKRTSLTLPQIADTLGVRHVLEGSVQRSGDRIRITAQLIDPRTDTHIWSESYDRELRDVFALQDDIAREVSAALLTRVQGLRPRAAGSRTAETGAYDAYLRGTYWRQRRTRDGLLEAIRAFEQAIALDAAYAPAYAALSTAHTLWVIFGYRDELDAYAHLARALRMAERAVALDSSSAEAYAARGFAGVFASASSERVLADLERAVRLGPSSGEIPIWHAVALAYARRYDEAMAEAETAIALDPLAPGPRGAFASIALSARRYDFALREARRARVLEPKFLVPLYQEALALLLLGRAAECARGEVGPYAAVKAMCLYSAGETARAAAIIDSLADSARGGARESWIDPGLLAADIATYHAWIGDAEKTVNWLRRAAEESPQAPRWFVVSSGVFDPVRTAPRFQQEFERIRAGVRARLERSR